MSKVPDPSDMSCSTYCKTSACTFTWTIHNFKSKVEKFIESSEFTSGKDEEIGWTLLLYPNGYNDEYKNNVSLFLNLKSCKQPVTVQEFSMSIIDKQRIKTSQKNDYGRVFEPNGKARGWLKFAEVERLLQNKNCLLPNGNLTILLEMVLEEGPLTSKTSKTHQPAIKRLRQILDNHNEIFISSAFSDITIIVGEKEIKAHKCILAAQSPVFLAMLNSDTLEASENSVKILDIEYDVVMEFLRYLYTGRTEKINEMAAELIYAADKYEVKGLKELCEDALQQQLTVENACDTFILADLHSCDRLECETLEFIRSKAAEVKRSAGFSRLTHAHLVKVIDALVCTNNQCEQ